MTSLKRKVSKVYAQLFESVYEWTRLENNQVAILSSLSSHLLRLPLLQSKQRNLFMKYPSTLASLLSNHWEKIHELERHLKDSMKAIGNIMMLMQRHARIYLQYIETSVDTEGLIHTGRSLSVMEMYMRMKDIVHMHALEWVRKQSLYESLSYENGKVSKIKMQWNSKGIYGNINASTMNMYTETQDLIKR